ncbi:RNA polymerase sigma factor [Nonomuraea purpurea]|uniref:RNA polymerase sigma factor n=1 Tax=Nonomuraea purpurea TaxID=1849276 RepID=A0ABV8G3E6_9ACTN
MWRTLSDDARQVIRDLCDKHGARLYDYCRTELAPGDAEQAVAGAMLTTHLYADRVVDPALRRPWLYAVARAHRAVVAKPASIGSWSRPGRMSELLPEALLSLERPHRELLDLSVRHGLSDPELAAIFELGQAEVRSLVEDASAALEKWFAAIIAARSRNGCTDLTARVAEWVTAPGRRARARIGRHIQSCATCRAAPRTMTAGALLRRLPITTLPGTLANRLALAQPLPGEGPIWRADGFPVQARTLVEAGSTPPPPAADAEPSAPVAGPTTATSGKPWSAAGADAADQEPPPARAARGRHPFTPPSRTRPFRGGAYGDKLVYTTVSKGESNGSHTGGTLVRYGGITLNGELPALRDTGPRLEDYWRERPEDDDAETGAPIRAVARLGLMLGIGLLVAGLVWAVMNARQHPAAITKAAAQTNVLLEEPSRRVAEVTKPSATAAPAAGAALASVAKKADLPKPAPPVAKVSPSSLSLGPGRGGSFSLSCTGRCQITSATATDGITVSGTSFKIQAPRSRPGCSARPAVERGRITIRWTGRTTGDGTRTGGVTAGKGSLTMAVAWSVATDRGTRVLDAQRGVHWSNCE